MKRQYNTNLFTWFADTKQFVAEESDLLAGAGLDRDDSVFCHIPNTPNAKGFVVVSERTGNPATFYVAETNKDEEGDIRFWLLKPLAQEEQLKPSLKDVTVLVFND